MTSGAISNVLMFRIQVTEGEEKEAENIIKNIIVENISNLGKKTNV